MRLLSSILSPGDSHSRVWHFANHATRSRHFDVCTGNSVTALGLNNLSSATGGLKRFRQKLHYGIGRNGAMFGAPVYSSEELAQAQRGQQEKMRRHGEKKENCQISTTASASAKACEQGSRRGYGGYDYVAVMVGEVDAGYGIWRRSHKYNTSVAEQIRLSVGGIFNFLAEVSALYPNPDTIVVMGLVLPPMNSSSVEMWDRHSR